MTEVEPTLNPTVEVLIAFQRDDEGVSPTGDPIFSAQAVEAGERRSVGEYVVMHIWR